MKWKKSGDLGRYLIDDPIRPKFETLRANKQEGVVVWYHLAKNSTNIDPGRFRKESTNQWALDSTVYRNGRDLASPTSTEIATILGLRKGLTFQMDSIGLPLPWMTKEDRLKTDCRQWEVPLPSLVGCSEAERTRDTVAGKQLTVRVVTLNYVSCSITSLNTIVLIPSLYLVRYGRPHTTMWDLLLED